MTRIVLCKTVWVQSNFMILICFVFCRKWQKLGRIEVFFVLIYIIRSTTINTQSKLFFEWEISKLNNLEVLECRQIIVNHSEVLWLSRVSARLSMFNIFSFTFGIRFVDYMHGSHGKYFWSAKMQLQAQNYLQLVVIWIIVIIIRRIKTMIIF